LIRCILGTKPRPNPPIRCFAALSRTAPTAWSLILGNRVLDKDGQVELENQEFGWEKTFTQKKQLSFEPSLAAWPRQGADAGTSGQVDDSLPRALPARSSPEGFWRSSESGQLPPGGRSGFPVKPALLAEERDGRQPTLLPPKRLKRSRTPKNPCRRDRDCGQTPESQAAISPTRVVLLPTCADPNWCPHRFEKRSSRTYWAKPVGSPEACRCLLESLSLEVASSAVFVGKRRT